MEAQMQMQIPLFNGDDHEIWSIKMRTLLMARDLWDVVESGVPDEKPYQHMGELASRQKDLRIKDMTALHMLQMSVTDSIFLRIGRATSSKQAWELLKADFGDTGEILARKVMELEWEYSLMVMKNGESVHEFINKFIELVNRLKFYGDLRPDYVFIREILHKLAPAWFEKDTVFYILCHEKHTLIEVLCILREAKSRNEFEKRYEALPNHNKRGRR